jgi:phosphatidylglycerol---prolipoprotein diacylglyceryl transferase
LSTIVVLAVLLTIYYKYNKKPPEGSLFGSFLVLLFSGRFLIEFTKLHHSDFEEGLILNMGQWLSIPLVLFGLWLIIKKVNWKKQGK